MHLPKFNSFSCCCPKTFCSQFLPRSASLGFVSLCSYFQLCVGDFEFALYHICTYICICSGLLLALMKPNSLDRLAYTYMAYGVYTCRHWLRIRIGILVGGLLALQISCGCSVYMRAYYSLLYFATGWKRSCAVDFVICFLCVPPYGAVARNPRMGPRTWKTPMLDARRQEALSEIHARISLDCCQGCSARKKYAAKKMTSGVSGEQEVDLTFLVMDLSRNRSWNLIRYCQERAKWIQQAKFNWVIIKNWLNICYSLKI